jgi:hypothetical protein
MRISSSISAAFKERRRKNFLQSSEYMEAAVLSMEKP